MFSLEVRAHLDGFDELLVVVIAEVERRDADRVVDAAVPGDHRSSDGEQVGRRCVARVSQHGQRVRPRHVAGRRRTRNDHRRVPANHWHPVIHTVSPGPYPATSRV